LILAAKVPADAKVGGPATDTRNADRCPRQHEVIARMGGKSGHWKPVVPRYCHDSSWEINTPL
jgi:hypothetical protein